MILKDYFSIPLASQGGRQQFHLTTSTPFTLEFWARSSSHSLLLTSFPTQSVSASLVPSNQVPRFFGCFLLRVNQAVFSSQVPNFSCHLHARLAVWGDLFLSVTAWSMQQNFALRWTSLDLSSLTLRVKRACSLTLLYVSSQFPQLSSDLWRRPLLFRGFTYCNIENSMGLQRRPLNFLHRYLQCWLGRASSRAYILFEAKMERSSRKSKSKLVKLLAKNSERDATLPCSLLLFSWCQLHQPSTWHHPQPRPRRSNCNRRCETVVQNIT